MYFGRNLGQFSAEKLSKKTLTLMSFKQWVFRLTAEAIFGMSRSGTDGVKTYCRFYHNQNLRICIISLLQVLLSVIMVFMYTPYSYLFDLASIIFI